MYLLESNEPSEQKQLKILAFAVGARVSTLLVMGMPLMNKGRSPC
jgi:hypothetical protein